MLSNRIAVEVKLVAHPVGNTKDNYLSAQYHRLARRIGKPKAVLAVAHSLLGISITSCGTSNPTTISGRPILRRWIGNASPKARFGGWKRSGIPSRFSRSRR